MKIVERAMNNCYLGDRTFHPSDHFLFIHELCEFFKCAGISINQVKRKLFSLSLKGRATEWYKTLKDGRPIGWEEIVPLFYSRDFYFRALRSLVVLNFPQLVSFSSVFPKPLSETLKRSSDGGFPLS
jgi:hypothetical protein